MKPVIFAGCLGTRISEETDYILNTSKAKRELKLKNNYLSVDAIIKIINLL